MEWYVFILIVVLFFSCFSELAKVFKVNIDKVILIILCAILFLFAALRNWDVGADTISYINIFNFVKWLSFEEITKVQANYWWDQGEGFKYTYKYILKILSFISTDSQIVTIFNSILLILGLYYSIRNYSKDYWLSILVFICFGFFQTSINLIRIAITFFICYSGVCKFQKDNNYLRYAVHILAAYMIHSASIFFSVFLIINKLKLSKKMLIVYGLILISVLVTGVFLSDWLINIIMLLSQFGYGEYFVNIQEKNETIIIWGTELIFVLFVLLINKFDSNILNKYKADVVMFLLVTLFSLIAIKMSAFARLTGYFNMCLIYFIPNLLWEIRQKKKLYICSKLFLCVLMIFMYISRLMINNIGSTMPYKFFFW